MAGKFTYDDDDYDAAMMEWAHVAGKFAYDDDDYDAAMMECASCGG